MVVVVAVRLAGSVCGMSERWQARGVNMGDVKWSICNRAAMMVELSAMNLTMKRFALRLCVWLCQKVY